MAHRTRFIALYPRSLRTKQALTALMGGVAEQPLDVDQSRLERSDRGSLRRFVYGTDVACQARGATMPPTIRVTQLTLEQSISGFRLRCIYTP